LSVGGPASATRAHQAPRVRPAWRCRWRARRRPAHPLLPYTTLFRSSTAAVTAASALAASDTSTAKIRPPRSAATASPLLTSRSKDRKSTRLNSSHVKSSYAVFCLKKKKRHHPPGDNHPDHRAGVQGR